MKACKASGFCFFSIKMIFRNTLYLGNTRPYLLLLLTLPPTSLMRSSSLPLPVLPLSKPEPTPPLLLLLLLPSRRRRRTLSTTSPRMLTASWKSDNIDIVGLIPDYFRRPLTIKTILVHQQFLEKKNTAFFALIYSH